jgi:translation initiation factor 2B subunit (eIF-2B alpha/beta/delta family)
VTDKEPGLTFGVEASTVEEFLRLLKEREEGETSPGGQRSATRRAVFVAQMLDQRSSSYGYPSVRRYVFAAFAYGRDLVSLSRTSSSVENYLRLLAELQRGSRRPTKRSRRI